MLFDGSDIVTEHVADLKQRIEVIEAAIGKTIYSYNQDEFMDKAKILQFPAIGIFYGGLQIIGDRRSDAAEMKFDLIVVDDSINGCNVESEAISVTTLLSAIRQELSEVSSGLQKNWAYKSEVAFDVGEKSKIAYVQRWTAIVTKI